MMKVSIRSQNERRARKRVHTNLTYEESRLVGQEENILSRRFIRLDHAVVQNFKDYCGCLRRVIGPDSRQIRGDEAGIWRLLKSCGA